MADDSSASVALGEVVIVGGGCYGTFYAGQLAPGAGTGRGRAGAGCSWWTATRPAGSRATMPGPPAAELVVEEWGAFFDRYLAGRGAPAAGAPDAIVPSPAHAAPDVRVAGAPRAGPLARPRGRGRGRSRSAPARRTTCQAPDGTRYVSFADWLCPVHCIEPAICPMIRAPAHLGDGATPWQHLTRRLDAVHPTAGPVLFICRHRVYGVGMFDVSTVLAGDAARGAGRGGAGAVDVLVATVSACHGAASLLRLA